jgi:hypothetical protein
MSKPFLVPNAYFSTIAGFGVISVECSELWELRVVYFYCLSGNNKDIFTFFWHKLSKSFSIGFEILLLGPIKCFSY